MPSKSAIFEVLQTVVIALAFYTVLHLFIAQPNKVDGSSMVPTFHTGDRILTSKLSYRFGEPQKGDIIVFTPPNAESGDYIKRIIGGPGDTITLRQGQVYVNNNLLAEPYLPTDTKTVERKFLRDEVPFTIPAGEYMVFGDNRNFSSDSREWGPITRKEIIGKATIQYWPLNDIRLIKHWCLNCAGELLFWTLSNP